MKKVSVIFNSHKRILVLAEGVIGKIRGLTMFEMMPCDGMIFYFPFRWRWAISMRGMRFPLDIVWIDDGKIVDLNKNAKVPSPDLGLKAWLIPIHRPRKKAKVVLELHEGDIDRLDLQIGMPICTIVMAFSPTGLQDF